MNQINIQIVKKLREMVRQEMEEGGAVFATKDGLPHLEYDPEKEKKDEAVQVNVDNLLKNQKIKNLMKRLGIKKTQSEEGIMKILNYLASNPSALSALKVAVGESVKEERDYKAEYKKYGSSTKAKKYRAELNKYNRQRGTYGNGDGKDASHKGGKIVGFEEESKNRGRREKSRLKKESATVNESAVSFWQDMFRPGPIPKKYIIQLIKKKGELPSKSHIKRIYKDNGNPSSSELAKTWKQLTKEKYVRAASGMWRWNADFTGWESIDESGLQYRMGVKRYGKEGMTKIQSAAGSGAGHAEIGKIKDKYDKKRKRKKESVSGTSVILEFDKYRLGGLLDSKLKKRLERTIKVIGGKVDAVGDDYIKFRMGGMDLNKLPAVITKLDRNKNVWIGDRYNKNIWDRKQKINKLEAFKPKGVSFMKKIVLLPKSKLYFDPSNGNFWLMGPGGEPDWEDDPIEPKDRDYKRTLSRLSSKDKSIMKKSLRGSGNWKEATTSVSVPGYLTPHSFSKSTQNAIDVDDEDDEKSESIIKEHRYFDLGTSKTVNAGIVTSTGFDKDKNIHEFSATPPTYSSTEAQKHVDRDVIVMSKFIGKASQQVIKTMMNGVKSGRYDAMDLQRGFQYGPVKRTHYGEIDFIKQLWTKVRDGFRRYSKSGKLR
tara:strand:- start:1759 stop:3723 length:1965 start_codon:yes stop_codon:yes gene_type:complete